ncbi:MocR-like transcription factor YczR [Luteipulveratus halotolerans]|uniref:HTH gntR-type domain-containing protein n=1 Tax=Luteipulveratus halotolerans TaxID=1631356 RepID=A0A0L6CGU0_9MICO|nr:PLP-dependent aminotransferase family protein [Luteipulveratus halotolerans]KNX37017.1 hypothetical protein VV01_07430 [Luteipulveratus halotolerans]
MSAPRVSAARLVTQLGPPAAAGPAYLWLADSIRLLVSDGRLLHGTRLPSERDLVVATGLSRTTVARAYAELRDRGYVTARRGSGTLVQVPGGPVQGGAEPTVVDDLDGPADDVIDLRSAAPTGRPGIAAAYERAVEQLGAYTAGAGYFPLGTPVLRGAVARRYAARGVPTDPGQVIVTTGSLSALAAVFRALLTRGDRALLESPTYPGALASLRHEGARLVPVPTASGASDLDAVAERAAATSPRVMLAMPDFHNPTGTLLEEDERERLAATWAAHGVVGVVDETVSELWLDARPGVRPMAAHAPRAVTVGGVSKSHWGGLRIGWIRAPHDLVGAIARARASFDLGAPVLEQLVVADLLDREPTLDAARRRELRERRNEVIGAVRAHLPSWETRTPPGGLSVWWRLPSPRSSALATAAERERVLLAPGSAFAVEGHGLEHWVRTPFALDAETLAVAVPRIAAAWLSVSDRAVVGRTA